MNEIAYQGRLVKKLKSIFPECFIIRNDPSENQGIPDILILFEDKWGMLEVKMSDTAHVQPNQEYYVGLFDNMSFCSFIYPGNETEVLHDLQSAFGIAG
jgi:hypothetical protein